MKNQKGLSETDITRLENRFKKVFLTKSNSDMKLLENRFKKIFLTKNEEDLEFLAKRLEEKFLTKSEFHDFKDNIFNKLDVILKEIIATREEITVLSHRSSDHEDRLEDIEKIHPQGKHIS